MIQTFTAYTVCLLGSVFCWTHMHRGLNINSDWAGYWLYWTCVDLLVFSLFCASIGWVTAQCLFCPPTPGLFCRAGQLRTEPPHPSVPWKQKRCAVWQPAWDIWISQQVRCVLPRHILYCLLETLLKTWPPGKKAYGVSNERPLHRRLETVTWRCIHYVIQVITDIGQLCLNTTWLLLNHLKWNLL